MDHYLTSLFDMHKILVNKLLKNAFALSGCILFAVNISFGQVPHQTYSTDCSGLFQPRHVYSHNGVHAFVGENGQLWLESPDRNLNTEGRLNKSELKDLQTLGNFKTTTYGIPHKVRGPYDGTSDEVLFDKIAFVKSGDVSLSAISEAGEMWYYTTGLTASVAGPAHRNGRVLCAECPGTSQDADFNSLSNSTGPYHPGWYKVTAPDGKNVVDIQIWTINTQYSPISAILDEDGRVWNTSEILNVDDGTFYAYFKGLSGTGAPYTRAIGDQSYKQITFPNNEKIIKIRSHYGGTNAAYLALTDDNKLYVWGEDYSNDFTPQELMIPGGAKVKDISGWDDGTWITGDDDLLYYLGSMTQMGNLKGEAASANESTDKHTVREATGWSDAGLTIDYVPDGNYNSSYGWGFVDTNGDFYAYFSTTTSNSYIESTEKGVLKKYEDFSPSPNLDYSSGIQSASMSIHSTSGIMIHTPAILARSNIASYGHHQTWGNYGAKYKSTRFPNMVPTERCFDLGEPYHETALITGGGLNLDSDIPNHFYKLNPEIISGPPTSDPEDVGEGGTLVANTINCAQSKIIGTLSAGTPSEVSLRFELNVTTVGVTDVTVSGSGLTLKADPYNISTQTLGPNIFMVPLVYDGSAFGTFDFTIDGNGTCSVDLSMMGTEYLTCVDNIIDLSSVCAAASPSDISK